MNFLFTLMVTLWKNGKVEISSSAEKYVRESISAFLRQWQEMPGQAGNDGREVFFNLGNKKSFVMRLEVSPEERIAFSSQKRDKERLAAMVAKTGSYIKAIKKLTKKEEI